MTEETKVPALFDFLDALGSSKQDLLTTPEAIKAFSPWVTNVAFSQHLDSIFYANEANRIFGAPPEAIYQFYLHALPAKRRFGKWAKKPKQEEDLVKIATQLLGWPSRRASELSKLLDKSQLQKLLARLDQGGV
jgi:hypothetical protein